jgi:23S rRNA (pseudouridine1915-N3)-methyltransferase
MRIAVVSVSGKQPAWIQDGFEHYAKRLKGAYRLELKSLPLARRTPTADLGRLVDDEGDRLLAAAPRGAHIVTLDESGSPWTTRDLAGRLEAWSGLGAPVALLIGGPDGLAPRVGQAADESWSLSALTLPHGLVRIVVAEALYRAASLLAGHPYHRG